MYYCALSAARKDGKAQAAAPGPNRTTHPTPFVESKKDSLPVFAASVTKGAVSAVCENSFGS
ncbi:hypothetical protein Stube_40310 [Streptomyces tubercidicus]|uniref:Uncharacterized protein n=1 Tax=Streptomyces tubercidicus TaxID=47759 RepID=A0A640UT92_9ACTN|nr:hypothetical protein Stube_40310 [Streptomyces tubercidicus]